MIKNASKDEWEFEIIRQGVPVWECSPLPPMEVGRGPCLVSFDKKTIYNLWSDSDKLSKAQKSLIKKAMPIIFELTCSHP